MVEYIHTKHHLASMPKLKYVVYIITINLSIYISSMGL